MSETGTQSTATQPKNSDRHPPKIGWGDFIILAFLAAAFVALRIISLGAFVTADEPTWGKRSASFYYALMDGDYANTYQDGHPGVTTMWAGAIAYHLKFPEYQRVGQVTLGDTKLLQLFQRHGPYPLELLAIARLNVVVANSLAMIVSFFFARRLFGRWLVVLGFLLIAFEPLHIAHSRFLHTNGMLASFMFLSVLAYLDYLQFQGWLSLLISGAASGLSFITITPGFNLIPIIFMLTLLSLRQSDASLRHQWKLKEWWRHLLSPLIIWGLMSLLTIFIVWPSMWVRPLGSLLDIIRYTLNVASGSDGEAQFVEAYQTLDDRGSRYLYFYPLTYIWRATPITLIGLILAVIVFLRPSRPHQLNQGTRRNLLLLLVYVAIYTAIMSLGSKKFDRYFLPVYLPLDIAAAFGWYALTNWLVERYPSAKKLLLNYILLTAVVAVQLAGAIRTAPYYLTCFNPVLGGIRKAPEVMTVGWGEGLNQAAIYLRSKPGGCNQRILSWYTLAYNWYSSSFGCEAQPVEFRADVSLEDYLKDYDYVLVYINQKQRNFPSVLLEYLNTQTPEKSSQLTG